ncbi:AAC(3) family N-acetyltransferase [Maridesulfovibrio frigidus]|uniref:AAC(3) family N-acetyltransferase n=1 Tax=Maridesulfovibrio frigidus TaxID=340956 RepID=UPI0004E15964|nr:AAC(3) family N-acetyltransferase [Maridesulfovibrio frigidus]
MILTIYRKLVAMAYEKYAPYRKKRAQRRLRWKRSMGYNLEYTPNTIPISELRNQFVNAGIKPDETIFIRISLSAAQAFEGGVKAYFDFLFDYFSPDGNIVMSSYTFNKSPILFLAENQIFDPKMSTDQLNLVSEMFRRTPGVKRSIHPTHSIVAYGKKAEWIVKDHHKSAECYGPQSPFARLYELKTKEISIGTAPTSISFHYVEQFMKPSDPGFNDLENPVMCRVKLEDEVKLLPFTVTDTFAAYEGKYSKEMLSGTAASPSIYKFDGSELLLYVSTLDNHLQAMLDLAKKGKFWYRDDCKLKHFVLSKIVKPLMLTAFFQKKNGILYPVHKK